MAIALVAHVAAQDKDAVTSSAVDTTGATILVVGLSRYQAGGAVTITDSKGNTYTALTAQASSNVAYSRIYYCPNPTVGSGHTFTGTGSESYFTIAAAAFSGVTTTSPFDVENGAVSPSSGAAPVISTGSVTPTNAGSLAAAVVAICDNGTTASVDSSYSISDQMVWVNNTAEGVALAWKEISAASNPQFTISGGVTDSSAVIAVFKPGAGGGGGGSTSPRTMMTMGVGH